MYGFKVYKLLKLENKLPKILENFAQENLYNADVTFLFYCTLSKTTKIKTHKVSKGKITILCYSNKVGKKDK